jgi:hypothetical protein
MLAMTEGRRYRCFERGLAVWYDEFSLKLGDSLRQSIDRGLARSRYGIVILSPNCFEKHWPQQELNGLAGREVNGQKVVIIPLWHKVGFEEVRQQSPMLADRVATRTDVGLEKLVDKILDAMSLKSFPITPQIRQASQKSKHTSLDQNLALFR